MQHIDDIVLLNVTCTFIFFKVGHIASDEVTVSLQLYLNHNIYRYYIMS